MEFDVDDCYDKVFGTCTTRPVEVSNRDKNGHYLVHETNGVMNISK